MPRESWSHESVIKFRQQFLRKLCEILVVANILLLLVTHIYQSINKDATDVFKGYGIIKWAYYASEVLYTVAHLIVSMELSSRFNFYHVKMMFGTLGFEMLLWAIVSYQAWFFINVAIFNVALLSALGPEFLRIQPTNIHALDNGPIVDDPSDVPGNGLNGNGVV